MDTLNKNLKDNFTLEWVVRISSGVTISDDIKLSLVRLLLSNCFKIEECEANCKRLCDSLSLYYDPNILSVIDGCTYNRKGFTIRYEYTIFIIIPDFFVENQFIVIVPKTCPVEAYHSYTFCKINKTKLELTSIKNFQGPMKHHKILYQNANEIMYHTWNFDNRNDIRVNFANGLLVLCVDYRDPFFIGSSTVHCHDTLSNKRWLYKSNKQFVSCPTDECINTENFELAVSRETYVAYGFFSSKLETSVDFLIKENPDILAQTGNRNGETFLYFKSTLNVTNNRVPIKEPILNETELAISSLLRCGQWTEFQFS